MRARVWGGGGRLRLFPLLLLLREDVVRRVGVAVGGGAVAVGVLGHLEGLDALAVVAAPPELAHVAPVGVGLLGVLEGAAALGAVLAVDVDGHFFRLRQKKTK